MISTNFCFATPRERNASRFSRAYGKLKVRCQKFHFSSLFLLFLSPAYKAESSTEIRTEKIVLCVESTLITFIALAVRICFVKIGAGREASVETQFV